MWEDCKPGLTTPEAQPVSDAFAGRLGMHVQLGSLAKEEDRLDANVRGGGEEAVLVGALRREAPLSYSPFWSRLPASLYIVLITQT